MPVSFIPLHKGHHTSRGKYPNALRKTGRQFYLTASVLHEAALAEGGIYLAISVDGKIARIQPAPNDDPLAFRINKAGSFSCSALHTYTGEGDGEWLAEVIGGEGGEIHVYLEGGDDAPHQ